MKQIQFRNKYDLTSVLAGKSIVASGACFDDSLLVVATDEPHPDPSLKNRIALEHEAPYSLTAIRVDGQNVSVRELQTDCTIFGGIQAFPDQSLLLLETNERENSYKGRIFDSEGQFKHQFDLGGALDVQVSGSGEIWVGYYDEAIVSAGFAVMHQGRINEYLKAQAKGLGCFKSDGRLSWGFSPARGFTFMMDCATLNVCREFVWTCYYTDFPLTRISSNKTVKAWKNTIENATALAVESDRFLFFGDDEEENTRCVLQTLDSSGQLIVEEAYEVVLPDGVEAILVRGRNGHLYAVAGSIWYELGFEDLEK